MTNDNDDDLLVPLHEVEYLACSAGVTGSTVIAIVTLRPDPQRSFAAVNLAISQRAARRLHDDLETLLRTEGSWLYDPSLRNPQDT
ncbi:MAG: hypothetical protein ABFD16_19610 [Thermoguttaceae bacterium]